MARQIKTILQEVRDTYLTEPQPKYWSDAELLAIFSNGCKDLWAAILDVYGDHFFVEDIDHVTFEASTSALKGVPDNVFRVHMIEPLDTTSASAQSGVFFIPRKFNHPDFISARAQSSTDPNTTGILYYDVSGAGAPVGAPIIKVAPQVSSTMRLRFCYNPTLPELALDDANPIPGESDQGLIAYTVAFARAKENESRAPDPNWIAVYATEKQSILKRITPRQDQEPDVVDGLFEGQY